MALVYQQFVCEERTKKQINNREVVSSRSKFGSPFKNLSAFTVVKHGNKAQP